MSRFKMLTMGALMGVAVLSLAASAPVPVQAKMTTHASANCPECFPIPPTCLPDDPCTER